MNTKQLNINTDIKPYLIAPVIMTLRHRCVECEELVDEFHGDFVDDDETNDNHFLCFNCLG